MSASEDDEKVPNYPIYPGVEEFETNDVSEAAQPKEEVVDDREPRNRVWIFIGSFVLIALSFVTIKTLLASYHFPFAQVIGLVGYIGVCLLIAFGYLRSFCKTSYGVWGFNFITTLLLYAPDVTSLPNSEKAFTNLIVESGRTREQLMNSSAAYSFAYDWYGEFIGGQSLLVWMIALFVTWVVYKSNLKKGNTRSMYYGSRYLKNATLS